MYRLVKLKSNYFTILNSDNNQVRVSIYYSAQTARVLMDRAASMLEAGERFNPDIDSKVPEKAVIATVAVFSSPEEFVYDCPESLI